MEFDILKENKRKAKKRRIRNEKKWRPFRCVALISLLISIVAFVIGIFGISYGEYAKTDICGCVFAISLTIYVIVKSLLSNLSSHLVTDRLNERIWIENGNLYHFIQTSFAAGINSWSADENGYLFAMDIASIREAKFDARSGRIEFKSDGKGKHYSDHLKGIVDKEWTLNGFPAVFYDYTEPSLQKTLEAAGVTFENKILNFKICDDRI